MAIGAVCLLAAHACWPTCGPSCGIHLARVSSLVKEGLPWLSVIFFTVVCISEYVLPWWTCISGGPCGAEWTGERVSERVGEWASMGQWVTECLPPERGSPHVILYLSPSPFRGQGRSCLSWSGAPRLLYVTLCTSDSWVTLVTNMFANPKICSSSVADMHLSACTCIPTAATVTVHTIF